MTQKLLALYALQSVIEDSICRASDPLVSRAKLGWWAEALLPDIKMDREHPLLSALTQSGAYTCWNKSDLAALFSLANERIDADGLKNENELRQHCETLGLLQLRLEVALQHDDIPENDMIRSFAALNGFMQLFRESFFSRKPDLFWVPLTLLARHQVSRLAVSERFCESRVRTLIGEVCQLSLAWVDGEEVQGPAASPMLQTWSSRQKHWLILAKMQQRQLMQLKSPLPETAINALLAKRLFQPGVADAWSSWRVAKAIEKGKLQL